MTSTLTRALSISIVLFGFINLSYAQNKPAQNILQAPPAGITIDGDLQDWGDSLRYLNKDKHISFSLANDKENLYMAIRVNDFSEQVRILNAGLTLSINTKGSRKSTFSITFPVGEDGGLTGFGMSRQNMADSLKQDRGQLAEAQLTKLRNIRVTGFVDIEGNMITTSNTYGIKTAMDYDKDGYLVCEAAIPLKFFHADDLTKNEWAFNFKINGIIKPQGNGDTNSEGLSKGGPGGGMGGGRGGRMGGGGGRGGRIGGGRSAPQEGGELTKSEDFWEKFFLAK